VLQEGKKKLFRNRKARGRPAGKPCSEIVDLLHGLYLREGEPPLDACLPDPVSIFSFNHVVKITSGRTSSCDKGIAACFVTSSTLRGIGK